MKLYNTKSYFDQFVTCPSAFDRDLVAIFENKVKDVQDEPMKVAKNIVDMAQNEILELVENVKKLDIETAKKCAKFGRNALFYLVILMEMMPISEQMMNLQMIALNFNDLYCQCLDRIAKEDMVFVQIEMDKVVTFQNSKDCTTPNILRENFLEMSKNKEILKLVKANLVQVDFAEGLDGSEEMDLDEMSEMTKNFVIKEMQSQGMPDDQIQQLLAEMQEESSKKK